MRFGFALPQIGPSSGPTALITVARKAEAMGYDSLWVGERVLFPVAPRAPYPASVDGALPDQFRTVLDPLNTLAFVAGHTERIRLGTSVINMPNYNPVMLARQLTTIDVLSGGRLDVGLGMGWSPDEAEATGAQTTDRGKRADEFVQVLKAIWTTNPVAFDGEYFQIAESLIGPKPIQKPHPPLYFAAYTPGAMMRAARFGNGWNAVGVPVEGMRQMLSAMQGMAQQFGRNGDELGLIVRAICHIADGPVGDGRPMFVGSIDEIARDVADVDAMGADEVLFDALFSAGVHAEVDILDRMELLWASTH